MNPKQLMKQVQQMQEQMQQRMTALKVEGSAGGVTEVRSTSELLRQTVRRCHPSAGNPLFRAQSLHRELA